MYSYIVCVLVCVSLWQILPQCLPQVRRLPHALSVACNEIVFPFAKCTLREMVCVCECVVKCVFVCDCWFVDRRVYLFI